MDQMDLDYLKSENGEAVQENVRDTEGNCPSMKPQEPERTAQPEQNSPARTETVEMPEGEIQFELSDFEEDFNVGSLPGMDESEMENFTQAQEGRNPSGPSSRSSGISSGQAERNKKPSVRKELNQIKLRAGARGYTFIADQKYEKDGEIRQGYVITKAYDISQIRTKPPEPPEPKPIQTLMGVLLKDTETRVSIADNLPENVQAQYIPRQRTIFVRNGMSEEVTFHAINRELACAAMDSHDGTYSRAEAVPQAFCAAYVMAEKYGVDCSGFDLDKICEMQEYGNKEPLELRAFIGNVKNAVYRISRHINRNLGQPEQEFMPDEFAVSEGMKGEVPPPEMPKAEEPAEKPAEKSQKQKGGKSKKQAER